ncbi:hypothetical protein EN46_21245 [Citrobacter amalonaticus]
MISDEQVRSSPPFLHRGLFPVIHKIGADVVPVEPFIPRFSGWRDDPGSSDSDNFHTFYIFRQGNRFWQSDRLAAVTEKYAGFHYLSP